MRILLLLIASAFALPLSAQVVTTSSQRLDDVEAIPYIALPGSIYLGFVDDVGTAPLVVGGARESALSPRFVFFNELYSGARVLVGEVDVSYIGTAQVSQWRSTVTGGTGNTLTMSWSWSFDGTCVKITVSLERDPGQSTQSFVNEFSALVEAKMTNYPPSCSHQASSSRQMIREGLAAMNELILTEYPEVAHRLTAEVAFETNRTTAAPAAYLAGGLVEAVYGGDDVGTAPIVSGPPASNGTMAISWKHDPDGAGPLQSVTVTASVELDGGESTRSAAKRLKSQVDALMAIFPPNVSPEPNSGG